MIDSEKCLICRRKTHGSIFCSLKHYEEYNKNKTKYRKRKIIIEIKDQIKIDREMDRDEKKREKETKSFEYVTPKPKRRRLDQSQRYEDSDDYYKNLRKPTKVKPIKLRTTSRQDYFYNNAALPFPRNHYD